MLLLCGLIALAHWIVYLIAFGHPCHLTHSGNGSHFVQGLEEQSTFMVYSSYRYVTRRMPGNKSRKAPGWYVQGPGSKVALGPFADELQAVASIAKTLNVKPADLLRPWVQGPSVQEEAAVSTYRYVTKRILQGATYWMGQPTRRRQKLFKDIKKAAAWTAKQRKTTVKALLKGSALHGCSQYRQRLAAVLHVYGNGSQVPGDVEFARTHALSMERMISQEPAIEIFDVQGKYGPFRKALAETFKRSLSWYKVHRSKVLVKKLTREYRPVPVSRVLNLQEKYTRKVVFRAHHLLAVLRRTVHAVQGKDFTCWVRNCGRNVSFHSGFIPMLLRFKLLRKVPWSTVPSLDLGSTTGLRYQLRTDNLVQVLSHLCQVIRLADAIKEKLSSVPRPQSCAAWCRSFRILSMVVKECPCPGMRNETSYLPLWTMRIMLLRRMYIAGATRLRVDNSLWSAFAMTFPDQKTMLDRVVKAEPGLTCAMAIRKCGYTGPPELMTMYLCFLGAIDRTSTRFLIRTKDIMAKARADYKKENGQNPVLKELVQIVKESMCRGPTS